MVNFLNLIHLLQKFRQETRSNINYRKPLENIKFSFTFTQYVCTYAYIHMMMLLLSIEKEQEIYFTSTLVLVCCVL